MQKKEEGNCLIRRKKTGYNDDLFCAVTFCSVILWLLLLHSSDAPLCSIVCHKKRKTLSRVFQYAIANFENETKCLTAHYLWSIKGQL